MSSHHKKKHLSNEHEVQRLVEENVRLVYHVVNRAKVPRWLLDDAYGEGMLALVRAAKKYNKIHQTEFSTYAYISIMRQIWKLCRREIKHAKMCQHQGDTYSMQSSDVKSSLDSSHVGLSDVFLCIGDLPENVRRVIMLRIRGYSLERIAKLMGVSLSKISNVLQTARDIVLGSEYFEE